MKVRARKKRFLTSMLTRAARYIRASGPSIGRFSNVAEMFEAITGKDGRDGN